MDSEIVSHKKGKTLEQGDSMLSESNEAAEQLFNSLFNNYSLQKILELVMSLVDFSNPEMREWNVQRSVNSFNHLQLIVFGELIFFYQREASLGNNFLLHIPESLESGSLYEKALPPDFLKFALSSNLITKILSYIEKIYPFEKVQYLKVDPLEDPELLDHQITINTLSLLEELVLFLSFVVEETPIILLEKKESNIIQELGIQLATKLARWYEFKDGSILLRRKGRKKPRNELPITSDNIESVFALTERPQQLYSKFINLGVEDAIITTNRNTLGVTLSHKELSEVLKIAFRIAFPVCEFVRESYPLSREVIVPEES